MQRRGRRTRGSSTPDSRATDCWYKGWAHCCTGRREGGRRGRVLWGLVALYGLGGLIAAKYPTLSDKEVLPGISEDRAHDIAGTMSFASIIALSAVTPHLLGERPAWRGWWCCFSYGMFVATTALALPFHLRIWPHKRGLLQRGFFATTMAWVLATALRLRKLS